MILIPTRSPEELVEAIASLEVETNPKYQPRDVTGDGLRETFCNVYVVDLMAKLGVVLPSGLKVNALVPWLRSSDWVQCVVEEAGRHANQGRPSLATWVNDHGPHGHIMALTPTPNGEHGVWGAQAGSSCFSCAPITHGFGSLPVVGWVHA